MNSATAKNLEAISDAIDQHNRRCAFPAAEVRMNHFEIERLGWDEIRGLPVVADSRLGTGSFRIICGNADHHQEQVDTVSTPTETRTKEPV